MVKDNMVKFWDGTTTSGDTVQARGVCSVCGR
jgi:hypothetical protein